MCHLVLLVVCCRMATQVINASLLKGERKHKCISIALIFVVHARRSGMDHTVLPAISPMPAFTS